MIEGTKTSTPNLKSTISASRGPGSVAAFKTVNDKSYEKIADGENAVIIRLSWVVIFDHVF